MMLHLWLGAAAKWTFSDGREEKKTRGLLHLFLIGSFDPMPLWNALLSVVDVLLISNDGRCWLGKCLLSGWCLFGFGSSDW